MKKEYYTFYFNGNGTFFSIMTKNCADSELYGNGVKKYQNTIQYTSHNKTATLPLKMVLFTVTS